MLYFHVSFIFYILYKFFIYRYDYIIFCGYFNIYYTYVFYIVHKYPQLNYMFFF